MITEPENRAAEWESPKKKATSYKQQGGKF